MTRLFACRLLDDNTFDQLKPAMFSNVPPSCAKKASGYYHANDAQRHLLGELLTRYALFQSTGIRPVEEFITGEKGKPGPEGYNGIHFNASHSGSWVVVAVSNAPVGTDVERIRKVPEGVAYRYFSEPEKQLLDQAANDFEKAHIFFTLWTLKESFLKAIGKGLTKSLSSFTVQKNTEGNYFLEPDPETIGFHLKTYSFEEGYKLAACAQEKEFEETVNVLNVTDLLIFEH